MKEIFEQFKDEMFRKFSERLNKEGNTATPWKDFNIEILEDRLSEEIREFQDCFLNYYYASNEKETEEAKRAMLEELVDVANHCLFLWVKLREEV